MVWILYCIELAFSLSFNHYDDFLKQPNNHPIIGVLTAPPSEFGGEKALKNGYIAASYVKFLESAGVRVIPLFHNATKSETNFLLSRINGILLPDAFVELMEGEEFTPYMEMIDFLIQRAIEMNDKGEYFPIFGISLGMKAMHLSVSRSKLLGKYDGLSYNTNVFLTDQAPHSKLFENADRQMIEFIRNFPVTAQNHMYGIHPKVYQSDFYSANPKISEFFALLGLSIDKSDGLFVAVVEARHYPFYGVMFHPQKPAFEWEIDQELPHDLLSIEVAQYFSTFFAVEARKSQHQFETFDLWMEFSIYNYISDFMHRPYEQVYFF